MARNNKRIYRVMLTLCLFYAGLTAQAADAPPAPVVIADVSEITLSPTILTAGSVISRNDARIAAEITGRLVSVSEVGVRVAKGDEIARIDDIQLRFQGDEYRADVMRVEARLKFLEQEVIRLRRLAKENNAAKTRLEQTESDRDVAKGDLALSRARLSQIEDRLNKTVVRAPFDGLVAERFLQPGEWADSGDKVVHLVDPGSLEIRTMVPLSSMSFLKEGLELQLQDENLSINGRIRSLVTVGDAQSRLLEVRIDFTGLLWPAGKVVRVAVPVDAARLVTALPRDALVLRRSGTAVFRLLDDDTAERVEVATGIAQDGLIEVIGDIRAGDRVVIRGGERLRPGQKVKIVSSDS